MLPRLSRRLHPCPRLPERVLQFGGGNFLRAFADWAIQEMNQQLAYDTGVVVVKPTSRPSRHDLNEQDGLFTLTLTGLIGGQAVRSQQLIDCIQRQVDPYQDFEAFLAAATRPELRLIISNTTEAGIVYEASDQLAARPPASFPGKLTRLLWERFQAFEGAPEAGLIVLPCELIEANGDTLREIVLRLAKTWELPPAFITWTRHHCHFCNTLVDRIVPGYPQAEIEAQQRAWGYQDPFTVEAERFHLWVIEGPEAVAEAFPADQAGLNVIFTQDLDRYRLRKVRILNGAHTAMVPIGYLAGLRTVHESLSDEQVGGWIREMLFEEVVPFLPGDPRELQDYAGEIITRLLNPSLQHALSSIALNSTSKFRSRLLPSLLTYVEATGELPPRLVMALASLLRFYAGELDPAAMATVPDTPAVVARFRGWWEAQANGTLSIPVLTQHALAAGELWGQDLNQVPGLGAAVSIRLQQIIGQGMAEALKLPR